VELCHIKCGQKQSVAKLAEKRYYSYTPTTQNDGCKMSDIKELDQKNKPKPVDSAVNKIRESVLKEKQKKIDEKVKAALDAKRIYNTLCGEIKDLIKEQEFEKLELSAFLDELQ